MEKKMEYIKTDRNGTKYFMDYTCKRCGGAGHSDMWIYTGKTCYECGGSGLSTGHIVKVYTTEYEAKLQAKKEAKNKQMEAHFEELVQEFKAEEKKRRAKHFGFSETGKGFVYCGNTYAIKDELKAGGARWNNTISMWISAQQIGSHKSIEIAFEEFLTFHSSDFNTFELYGDKGYWEMAYNKIENWIEQHKSELKQG